VPSFNLQWFLDPVNSLAARGKKTGKSAPQLVSKTIPAAAIRAADGNHTYKTA